MTSTSRYAAISAVVLVAIVAAYAVAPRTTPTLADLATPGCVIVEHGPTGPELDVTLGLTREVCGDTVVVTSWELSTGVVIDVDVSPYAPCGYVADGDDVVPAPCSTVEVSR